jgi:hypothetical protein
MQAPSHTRASFGLGQRASVFQNLIGEARRRTGDGQSEEEIADELRTAIEAVLDDLDQWLASSRASRPTRRFGGAHWAPD